MTDTLHISTTITQDGEIHIADLPVRRGQTVELSVRVVQDQDADATMLTAQQLLVSGLIGLWSDREDIGDSVEYARQLRTQAQQRGAT